MTCFNFLYLNTLDYSQLFDLFIKSNSKIVVFSNRENNIVFKDNQCYINYSNVSSKEDILLLVIKAFILNVLLKNNLLNQYQECYLFFQNQIINKKKIEYRKSLEPTLDKLDVILYKTYKDNF